jgi:tape measure domain-containing protein
MSSVEDKIVGMKFDNKQFEPAAKQTLSTLDRLKAALNFGGVKNKGLEDIQASANKFSLGNVMNAASQVGGKFSAMSVLAIGALASIANRAVGVGVQITKALTIEPMMDGFREYETKIGSIQTIMSNTARYGTKLPEVNKVLNDLNHYADKTIYNFGEMTKNIGLFTNAGIKVKDAASMIKGFSNEAAASGTTSQGAAGAAYQLSQALSTGTIRLMDWRSLSNVGMGNKNMQKDLITLADSMGTLKKAGISAKDVGKDFNGSLEKKWLSADVMSKYLKIMAGDMSDAQMKSLGLNDAQIKLFKDTQQDAEDAATKVRTFSQLTGTLKEAVGSSWGQTAEILFGGFDQATDLFTGINDKLTDPKKGIISKMNNARNNLLSGWSKMGGRNDVIKSFGNIFNAVVKYGGMIKDAFRSIFPATTAKQLYDITHSFLEFTQNLKLSGESAKNLKKTFAGVFAIFDIGWQAVKALAGVLGDLFHFVADGSDSFLGVTANIGDFLVNLDKTIKKGDVFNKFFGSLENVVGGAKDVLVGIGKALGGLFSGVDGGPAKALGDILSNLGDRLKPLAGAAHLVGAAWDGMIKIFSGFGRLLQPVIDGIATAFSGVGTAIANALAGGDFSSVFDILNTVLLGGVLLVVKKFVKDGLKIDIDAGGGLFKAITGTFGQLTDTLKAMQSQIQAKIILEIAGAVALLAASIVILSLIDSKKLTKSLTAIGVAFGYLLGAMAILTKISGNAGFVKIPIIAASMILLATALLILSASVKILSGLSWEELAKGLVGVGAVLGMIVGVAKGLDKSGGSMLRAGLAMIPLALGILILSKAVESFGNIPIATLATGLIGMAAALVIIGLAVSLMPKTMALQAAGLVILGGALLIIGQAISNMGGMSIGEIAKGLVVLAGSLILIAAALLVMEGSLPGAAALIVAAGALAILAPALVTMSGMSWGEIAKGMVVLGGALLILSIGLALMTAALPGAAALLIASAALAILAPVLVILGGMSWEAIAKGLAAIAGAFAVLGVAGLLLTPVIPSIVLLAGALLILGVGIGLVGVGVLAIATAFSIFVAAGTAGIAVLLGMIQLIPAFMIAFAEGIGGFAVTIASQGVAFTAAFVTLIGSLLSAVITLAPKIGAAFNVLIATGLAVLITNIPKIANAGLRLIIGLMAALNRGIPLIVALSASMMIKMLNGITQKIPAIVAAAVRLISRFLDAIGNAGGKLADAGAKMVIKLVNGVASAIRSNQGAMNAAGRNLASAIASGMTGGLSDKISSIAGAAARMAHAAIAAAKNALDSHSPSKEFHKLGVYSGQGMANGLKASEFIVQKSAENVSTTALAAVKNSMKDISSGMIGAVNLDPTIKPVLDLSEVTKGASQIGGMLDQKAISADVSYRNALGIVQDQQKAQAAEAATAQPVANDKPIQFIQNNNSPKELSTVELYRNTNSQLAMAKEALKSS